MDKEYLEAVKSEICNIKKHATEQEKGALNINLLIPETNGYCIYGLMTGTCHSNRAIELITLCATKEFGFCSIKSDMRVDFKLPTERLIRAFTPLEHYITNYRENNAHILNFIKGKTEKLALNHEHI